MIEIIFILYILIVVRVYFTYKNIKYCIDIVYYDRMNRIYNDKSYGLKYKNYPLISTNLILNPLNWHKWSFKQMFKEESKHTEKLSNLSKKYKWDK